MRFQFSAKLTRNWPSIGALGAYCATGPASRCSYRPLWPISLPPRAGTDQILEFAATIRALGAHSPTQLAQGLYYQCWKSAKHSWLPTWCRHSLQHTRRPSRVCSTRLERKAAKVGVVYTKGISLPKGETVVGNRSLPGLVGVIGEEERCTPTAG